jgi:hypothetical protein
MYLHSDVDVKDAGVCLRFVKNGYCVKGKLCEEQHSKNEEINTLANTCPDYTIGSER